MFDRELAALQDKNFADILIMVGDKDLKQEDRRHLSFLEHLYMHEHMKEALFLKNEAAVQLFDYVVDQSGPAQQLRVLQSCIKDQRHDLIKLILDKHVYLLDKRGAHGLNPLALAIQCYRESPTKLSLSIVNQLYFPCAQGDRRNQILDKSVNLEGNWFSHPIWQYGVEFCIKYDGDRNAVAIDLDWLDFVTQAIKDGLSVYGTSEGMPRFINHVRAKYGEDVYNMLTKALSTLQAGLPGRTNAQTKANSTLASYSEFAQRASPAHGTQQGIALQSRKTTSYSTLGFLARKPSAAGGGATPTSSSSSIEPSTDVSSTKGAKSS